MTKSKCQNKSKFQISNTKTYALSFVICASNLFWILCFGICHLTFAQDVDKLVALSKQIIEAKTNQDLYAPFKELKELYYKDDRYSDFVEFLKSLGNKKKTLEPFTNYYIALSRYHQLKYLEETKNWDEYFSSGNTYRNEITQAAQKTINSTLPKDALYLYARLILWQFHKDQQDAFAEAALSDLMSSVLEYAKDAKDAEPIKEVADKLLSYAEKGKSKELYKIYVDKIVTSDIKDDELNSIALRFYEEGNLDLSETIYDLYIDRIVKSTPKEKLIPLLIDIAKLFAYKDEGANDMLYAEKLFKKIEEIGGKEIFDQELIYLRAFNLEKTKEYPKAKDSYLDLVKQYPFSTYADEANFKIGIIYTYILRDIKSGKSYFEKLAQKETLSSQVISSLYQLGLLSQWENDSVKAKEYYSKLIEKAKDKFVETKTLTQERLKEIEEAESIEYNLKTFLDVSLIEEYAVFDATKVDLSASPYKANKGEEINICSTPYTAESGCMQIELQYLWSGHLGTTKLSLDEPSFNTTYIQPGTKEINLVVVSPTGIIDRNLDLVDVY